MLSVLSAPSKFITSIDFGCSLDAVQCARCKCHFHMSCVNPPLLAKPSRGYGWTCAPCSRRHEDQVDSGDIQPHAHQQAQNPPSNRGSTPKVSTTSSAGSIASTAPTKAVRGRGRPRKEKPGTRPLVNEEEIQVKHYKLWPFRYFG